jgi:ribosome-binding protein aMBF1 (putative translation factor)
VLSPAQLLELAEQAERDREEWQARADESARQRDELRKMARKAATKELLHNRSQSSTLFDVNATAAAKMKMNMSLAKSAGDPFGKACREKGLTQNGLAKKLKITASLLSMYRREKDPRPIPQARAEEVERLIGWKAIAKNWPGGIVQGD